MQPFQQAWHTAKKGEAHASVKTLVSALKTQDGPRLARYTEAMSLYEGRPIQLEELEYYATASSSFEPPKWNWVRSMVDTLHAEICGRQKPKPQVMGTAATWKVKRRAKKLDRFVEAQLHQAQGMYDDAWDLLSDVAIDWLVCGTGVAKVSSDVAAKRVPVERVYPWQVFVDARDAEYGDPLSFFHTYTMDEEVAVAAYGNGEDGKPDDAKVMQIRQAAKMPTDARIAKRVTIYEAWRRSVGDTVGRHVVCCDTCDLADEEFDEPEFPFVVFHFARDRRGYWGRGVPDEARVAFRETDETACRASERVRTCSESRTYFQIGSVAEKALREGGGATERLVGCEDLSQMPRREPAQPISSGEMEWLQLSKQQLFESVGISEMRASARKDQGVTAAIAMRTMNDIQTVRFLPRARKYEQVFPAVARRMIRAARKVATEHKGFSVKWPGGKFLREIPWSDVSIEEDMYEVRIASTNAFSRDPALVLQMAGELRASGDISRETYLEMIGMPDLDKLLQHALAEREYLEGLIDRYLDAETPEELDDAGGYEVPEPLITNKPGAMALFLASYFEAKTEGAPEYPLQLMRDWMSQMDQMIGAAQAPAPPPAMGPTGNPLAPPGMPPPGAVPPPMRAVA